MRTLWPPEAPSVQDGGDGIDGASETAQDPGPLLTGPATALWIGSGAFIVIFIIVLMLVIRGRVIAPARRRALADAKFFEPAGEGAEIAFDETEATETADAPKSRKERKIKENRRTRGAPPGDLAVALDRDAADEDRRATPEGDAARRAERPVLRAKKSASPFAGLFKKKNAEESPLPEPETDDDRFADVAITSRAPQDADDGSDFARQEAERRAAEDADYRRRAEQAREEAERRAAADRRAEEEAERARLADEERERLYRQARETEFERRKSEAALAQPLQSLSSMERRFAERPETPGEEPNGAYSRLDAALEARFERLADRLNAKIDSLALAGAPRANDDYPGFSRKMAAELSDMMRREIAALRASTENAIETLARRIDAMDAPPSQSAAAGATALAQEIARLNTLLSGRTAASTAGRIQLSDLVRGVLPAERYAFARQLSTGRTADCLIYAPNLAAPIAVDARFPVEAFDYYVRRRENPDHEARARDEYRRAVLRHVVDIAENLIAPEETADFAVMFVPSEAILNDLHADFADIVQDSYRARVWIVSPTSLMASLHMMTALAGGARLRSDGDAALREEIDALWARVEALESDLDGSEAPPAGAESARSMRPSTDEGGNRADRGDLSLTPEEDAFDRIEREERDLPPFPLRSQERD